MKRRSKVSQAALVITPGSRNEPAGIKIGETQGLVAPIPHKTTTVTLRLSGAWHALWNRLRAATPGVSDAELLRQGVALRMALAALDAKGLKPRAFIQYYDQSGELRTVDLEEHVGIEVPKEKN
ncbi:MAG: hypothetical protein AB1513_02925 [Pseudomonadota bacterium]